MESSAEEIKTFENLEAWKICRNLRRDLAEIAHKFPSAEKFRLSDQIIRASRSVTANIAEGYGRFYYQENILFCRQARGSLYELIDHLGVAVDEGYLSESSYGDLYNKIQRATSVLNGYIRFLKNEQISKRRRGPIR